MISSGMHHAADARVALDYERAWRAPAGGVAASGALERLKAQYANAKLLNALFAAELHRRVRGRGVVVDALDPAATRSRLNRRLQWYARAVFEPVSRLFFQPPARAARAIARVLATPPPEPCVASRYFLCCDEIRAAAAARSPRNGEELWALSERAVGAPFRVPPEPP